MLDTATMKSFQERFSFIRKLEPNHLVPEKEADSLTMMDLKPGSFFNYLPKTYYVKEINQYQGTSDDFKNKKDFFVSELTCLCLETGDLINFEWEYDDELEISMTEERLSFRDLKDDEGQAIDEDDLDQIAEDKDAVLVNKENFWYEDDWASVYQRGSKEENVYMYEFEKDGGSKFLTIEEWDSGSGKESYQIYTSLPVEPGNISVLSKGA
jgi:hypothetical protein